MRRKRPTKYIPIEARPRRTVIGVPSPSHHLFSRARIIQLRMPSPIRPSWSSSAVLGEGMWDSGGCDASYPLTPVSPFASLREEMSLGSVAVSSRGSGVSPLPPRRSLWSESEGVLLRSSRRQRAAHSHSDRSSSATPLSPRPRSFLLQRMRVPEGKSL